MQPEHPTDKQNPTENQNENKALEDAVNLAEVPEWEPLDSSSLLMVAVEQAGQRLDQFVSSQIEHLSRAETQRLISLPENLAEGIRVNGRRERASFRVRTGDRVTVQPAEVRPTQVEAEPIPLDVVYEDEDVLVINKSRGMVVHPAPGAEHGTLVNAVLAHADDLSGIGGELRPGIVHRLDKDTGGLLMVAKNDVAHRHLQAQIQARTASRRYLALVWGSPKWPQATVEAPIGRHPTDRKKMAVLTDPRYAARDALTEFRVRTRYNSTFTLLEATLQTGRTHQIRVHSAYVGYPIVGDPLYGGLRKLPRSAFPAPQNNAVEQAIAALDGQALHAYALAFDHPRTGKRLAFEVPLPAVFQNLLDRCAQE